AAAVVPSIDAAAGRHVVERRAADWPASRRTAIDVLPVAEFVVVIRRVNALCCVKGLQAVLAAGVDRQELLPVLLLVVGLKLRLRGPRRVVSTRVGNGGTVRIGGQGGRRARQGGPPWVQ